MLIHVLLALFCSDTALVTPTNIQQNAIVVDLSCWNFLNQTLRTLPPRITQLHLGHCRGVDNETCNSLLQVTSLEVLDLSYSCRFSDDPLIKVVRNNKKLKLLNLNRCEELTEKSLMAIQQSCPNLLQLHFSWFARGRLSFSIADLLSSCPKLQKIECETSDVIDIERVSTNHLTHLNFSNIKTLLSENLGYYFPHLVFLDLSYCQGITLKLIEGLANFCSEIAEIHLGKAVNLDEKVYIYFDQMKKLATLNLSFCPWVDVSLSQHQFCQNIKTFDLGGCDGVNDQWIDSIIFDNMQKCILSETQVTSQKIEGLLERFPNMEIVGSL